MDAAQLARGVNHLPQDRYMRQPIMKALLLLEPGDDYALTLTDVPTPTPGPGEVRLRVRASSINPVDYKFARSGAGLALPHVLGIDAAGEIDALGTEVQGWRLGDRVMALAARSYVWSRYGLLLR